jgi:hypothetical protein
MKKCMGLFIILLNFSRLFAQNQTADNLQLQFRNSQSNALQEKLFVHTDKTFYLTGETVWFKVYSVDASFHKPLATSSISYIEILNSELKPVIQSKVLMLNGSGNGFLALPAFLTTGNYIFRAYTSWMKNFSPDFYYEQTIHIVNTFKQLSPVTALKNPPSIQFFPEGGNLIEGFSEKIAFKAMNGNGRGLDCTGVIVNQNNDTVARFQSLHNGMGSFQFNPEKNSKYTAIVKLGDTLVKHNLPAVSDHGFAMNVTENGDGRLVVQVRATSEFNNTSVYLFSQTRQVLKNLQTTLIKDGSAVFQVDKKELRDGISGITLFNHLRQPVCERLVFKRPEESLFIQAKINQTSYYTRKPITIDLSTANSANLPLTGNLSVSVFMIDSLQHIPEQNIVSYLLLGSDLRGKIESPGYYFANADKIRDEALDNLLLTQGWRRFNWDEVLENRKSVFEFLPEVEGPVVNGKIFNKGTGATVGSSNAYLSVPGADYAFSSASSDAQGVIHFGFKEVYKSNAIVVQPSLLKDSNYRIDISNAYSEKYSSNPIYSLALSKAQESELINRSISNQVENTYAVDKKRRYPVTDFDTTSFYGIADRIYNLEDFTRFQTMEEVFREYVDDVRIRKDGDKFTFKVRNKLFNTYFEEDPLILLDGIPITDATKIVVQDPAKIKKIEVVTHNYYIGSSEFSGIVNVKSYSGELGATQLDPNSLVVEYEGLQQQREFYSPKYTSTEDEESHVPDFRNVLYWAPQVSTGPNGKTQLSFYSSDVKGKFAVVVQGISPEGLPGHAIGTFEVTDSR